MVPQRTEDPDAGVIEFRPPRERLLPRQLSKTHPVSCLGELIQQIRDDTASIEQDGPAAEPDVAERRPQLREHFGVGWLLDEESLAGPGGWISGVQLGGVGGRGREGAPEAAKAARPVPEEHLCSLAERYQLGLRNQDLG
jgi:hypothetical protein